MTIIRAISTEKKTAYRAKQPMRATKLKDISKLSRDAMSPDVQIQLCELFDMEQAKSGISERSFAIEHKIGRSTFKGWLKKYQLFKETGQMRFAGPKGGRIPLVDHQGIEAVESFVRDSCKASKAPYWHDVRIKLDEQAKETFLRRGIPCENVAISEKTFRRYKNALQANSRKAQLKTVARKVAERDVRNAFTMHCMAAAFCEDLIAAMIFNWDATTYLIKQNGEWEVVVPRKSEEDLKPTIESDGDTDFFVKLYHLNNALGAAAVPVLLLDNDKLGEEECIVTKCKGGGNTLTMDSGDYCYLVYCKTRAGNREFYRWFGKEVVAPYVKNTRAFYEETARYSDGSPMRAFVTCDGEAKQIEVFQEEDMIEVFKDAMIDFGKTPASCSAIAQASDVSLYFSCTKKILKERVHQDPSAYQNEILKSAIERSLQDERL